MIKIPFCFASAGICLLRAYDSFEAGIPSLCLGLMGVGGLLMGIGFIFLRRGKGENDDL